jgi:hypothetical protein
MNETSPWTGQTATAVTEAAGTSPPGPTEPPGETDAGPDDPIDDVSAEAVIVVVVGRGVAVLVVGEPTGGRPSSRGSAHGTCAATSRKDAVSRAAAEAAGPSCPMSTAASSPWDRSPTKPTAPIREAAATSR